MYTMIKFLLLKSYEILVKLKENLSKSTLSILELVIPTYTLRDKQLELIHTIHICVTIHSCTHIHVCTHAHTHTLNYNGYTAS